MCCFYLHDCGILFETNTYFYYSLSLPHIFTHLTLCAEPHAPKYPHNHCKPKSYKHMDNFIQSTVIFFTSLMVFFSSEIVSAGLFPKQIEFMLTVKKYLVFYFLVLQSACIKLKIVFKINSPNNFVEPFAYYWKPWEQLLAMGLTSCLACKWFNALFTMNLDRPLSIIKSWFIIILSSLVGVLSRFSFSKAHLLLHLLLCLDYICYMSG